MSLPTQELSNLSLDASMPAPTRQEQAQRRRRAEEQQKKEEAERYKDTAPRRPIAPAPAPATARAPVPTPGATSGPPAPARVARPSTDVIEGYSGIRYSNRQLSQPLRELAADTLRFAPYTTDSALRRENGNDAWFGFQFKKAETVHVYDGPSSNVSAQVTCTCRDFGARSLCGHIFWLYDSVNEILMSDIDLAAVQPLDKPSIERRLYELRDQIKASLPSLPDAFNFRRFDEAESDREDADEDLQILDMLSVLEEDKVLEDSEDEELLESVPKFEKSFQKMVVPGDMPATIFGLARYDRQFFERLRNAIPKEVCELDFISKLRSRANQIFKELEKTAQGGHLDPQFIAKCAKRLDDIPGLMIKYKDRRAPTSDRFNSEAGKLAVDILEKVCNRNFDVYDSPGWQQRVASSGTGAGSQSNSQQPNQTRPSRRADRNIFHALITRVPPMAAGSLAQNFFVLDLMCDSLPASVRIEQASRLRQLHAKLISTGRDANRFAEKLEECLTFHEDTVGGGAMGHDDKEPSSGQPEHMRRANAGQAESSRAGSSRVASKSRRPPLEGGEPEQRRRRRG